MGGAWGWASAGFARTATQPAAVPGACGACPTSAACPPARPPAAHSLAPLHVALLTPAPPLPPPAPCRSCSPAALQESFSTEEQGWVIRDGVVVIIKDSNIPDGTII